MAQEEQLSERPEEKMIKLSLKEDHGLTSPEVERDIQGWRGVQSV